MHIQNADAGLYHRTVLKCQTKKDFAFMHGWLYGAESIRYIAAQRLIEAALSAQLTSFELNSIYR